MASPLRWLSRRCSGSENSIKAPGPSESRHSGRAKVRSIFASKKLTESEYQDWIAGGRQVKPRRKMTFFRRNDPVTTRVAPQDRYFKRAHVLPASVSGKSLAMHDRDDYRAGNEGAGSVDSPPMAAVDYSQSQIKNPCRTTSNLTSMRTMKFDEYDTRQPKRFRGPDTVKCMLWKEIVDGYLQRLDHKYVLDGYVFSLSRIRTRVRVVVDHPLLFAFTNMMLKPVDEGDSGEPQITVYAAAGVSKSQTLTPQAERLVHAYEQTGFYIVRNAALVFCDCFNTESFRDAITVVLSQALAGTQDLLLRSAVMTRGTIAPQGRATLPGSGPALVVGRTAEEGDYSGNNHVWTDSGLSFVWYADCWKLGKQAHRDQRRTGDVIEGDGFRATRRIPLDTPETLGHPNHVIVTLDYEGGDDGQNAYAFDRYAEIAYAFLVSRSHPSGTSSGTAQAAFQFLKLVKATNPQLLSAVWGRRTSVVARRLALGYAFQGGKMGKVDIRLAKRIQERRFPDILCSFSRVIEESPIPAEAARGWQPSGTDPEIKGFLKTSRAG
uniref:Uncharacterized protein n=1 Tax=Rhodosorus marinus TaxID=101924 RepID=A0A7S0BFI5_9RHOD|mmetsp:Transcript_13131/g.18912  ORF Transcript_13131/g.18912 Transcript_13131/m.18912 type:complete len:549 (+) Transcript_13131:227-1873(+)